MDIWEWVTATERELRDSGHGRLADLIDRIPGYACDDEHAQLDAAVPEALALARDLELDHVEVFVRHWNLQSRVLHRMEAREFLPEAVSLLEFAHREENASCPQSVCVTQDLAIAYKQRDYVGFVPQRLAVCEETLDRIDPTWSCFECIGLEQVEAMSNGGDVEGALARLDELCDGIRRVSKGWYLEARLHRMDAQRVDLLELSGRLDEALALALERLEYKQTRRHESRHAVNTASLDVAKLFALMGRGEESVSLLENLDELLETPSHFGTLSSTLVALVGLGEVENDWRLGAQLWLMASTLFEQGVMRETVEIAGEAVKLAEARGAHHSALRALDLLERAHEELVAPHELLDELAPMRGRLEVSAAAREIPETDEALYELVGEDPERDLDLYLASFQARPDSELAFHGLASVYEALEMRTETIEHLRRGYFAHPDESRLMRYASSLASIEGVASARAFLEGQIDGAFGHVARFARARFGEGGPRERIEDIEALLEVDPQVPPARMMLAMAHRELGEHEDALRWVDAQIEFTQGQDMGLHWDRMTEATALGRWDIVRESAAILEFPVRSESGPIEDQYGYCKLRMRHEPDEPEVWAMRTGPTSATIVSMSRVGEPQRFDDVWAFDAEPLGEPPEEGDEEHVNVYGAVAKVANGPYGPTHSIDGPHPGEEGMERFAALIDEFGGVWNQRSPDTYVLTDGQTGDEVPGVYIVYVVPSEVDLGAFEAAVAAFGAGLDLPMQWYALARDAGRETAPHEAVCERFGIHID